MRYHGENPSFGTFDFTETSTVWFTIILALKNNKNVQAIKAKYDNDTNNELVGRFEIICARKTCLRRKSLQVIYSNTHLHVYGIPIIRSSLSNPYAKYKLITLVAIFFKMAREKSPILWNMLVSRITTKKV